MLRSLLVRAYRLALGIAPLGVDRRWTDRMVADFRDRLNQPEARGVPGCVGVAMHTGLDLLGQIARRRLGHKREVRSGLRTGRQRGGSTVETMLQDMRYAFRGIRRRPGFAIVVVVTLMLGIGANTTLFSVVNGVLLRPLPYPESERLHQIVVHFADGVRDENSSYLDMVDQRTALAPVLSLAAWHGWRPTLTAEGAEPRRLVGLVVSAGWFDVLGLTPSRGRFFSEAEMRSGEASEIVLSYGLWQSTFGADPDILGRQVELNGLPRTVIGVGPAEFPSRLPGVGRTDLWVPMEYEGAAAEELPGRGSHNLRTVARLNPGVDVAAAEAILDPLMTRLEEDNPGTNDGKGADLASMHALTVAEAATALKVLMAGVVVLLLIAVANVTSVLLGRAADREREMALRTALGAERSRLYGQLIAESMVLAVLGGSAGIAMAFWGTRALVAWGGTSIPMVDAVGVDGTVLTVTTGVVVAAGLLMGLIPAWWTGRRTVRGALNEGGGTRGTGGRKKVEVRGALVVAQVAMSLSLLMGAGLLVRSLNKLSRVDAGVDTSILTFGIHLPDARYPEHADRMAFHAELEAGIERIPGIQEVAAINGAPLSNLGICGTLYAEEDPDRFAGGDTCAEVRAISGDYFEVMGIPLLRGRSVSELDTEETPDVIVINRAIAELLFPGEEPLGKRIMTGFSGTFHEVVGVVADTKQFSLDEATVYQTYLSDQQWTRSAMNLMVRHEGDPEQLFPLIREAVWSLDPQLPLYATTTIGELRDATLAEQRFRTILIAGISALALLMATIGIYGVISYSVAQRQREMAIRLSIGAQARSVRRMIVGQALRLVMLGLLIGAVGGYAFGRALEALLFGVGRTDPVTLIGVPIVILCAALAASAIPAHRATRVDPMMALRE